MSEINENQTIFSETASYEEERQDTGTRAEFKDHGNLEDMYVKLSGYELRIHEDNQKRIKAGIRCLWIVPMVFMFLMFLTDSSKLIFLVLWIVSLFAIAVYLVYVEYSDHKLQEQMNEIRGIEESENEDLLNVEAAHARAEELFDEMHANDKEAMETLLGINELRARRAARAAGNADTNALDGAERLQIGMNEQPAEEEHKEGEEE